MILHKTKGVNPRMTVCYRCGKDAESIILLGKNDKKVTCSNCGTINYGCNKHDKCNKCGFKMYNSEQEEIGEYEKIPVLCSECEKEIESFKNVVSSGGIYFKCNECGQSGVIKKSDYSMYIRGIHTKNSNDIYDKEDEFGKYLSCGIEFNSCKEHQKE